MEKKQYQYDPIQNFFYDLLRDAAPAGEVERLMKILETDIKADSVIFTNGHLADYAKELADRFRKSIKESEKQ